VDKSISHWRLAGNFPRGRTPEEIKAQTIGDWQIWAGPWNHESAIVIPDAFDPTKKRRIGRYSAKHLGSLIHFARDMRDDGTTLIYFLAAADDADAIEAVNPKHEGYWRTRVDEESELPWPAPDEAWLGGNDFLRALDRVEGKAEVIRYRGFSPCRICGTRNGSQSFRFEEWDWPSGFRHYVAEHAVRPTAEFESFILRQHALTT
jgi:hypothetical protein